MKPVHPKVAGGGLGAGLGIALTAILGGLGLHISPEVAGAISTVAGVLAGFLTPAAHG